MRPPEQQLCLLNITAFDKLPNSGAGYRFFIRKHRRNDRNIYIPCRCQLFEHRCIACFFHAEGVIIPCNDDCGIEPFGEHIYKFLRGKRTNLFGKLNHIHKFYSESGHILHPVLIGAEPVYAVAEQLLRMI